MNEREIQSPHSSYQSPRTRPELQYGLLTGSPSWHARLKLACAMLEARGAEAGCAVDIAIGGGLGRRFGYAYGTTARETESGRARCRAVLLRSPFLLKSLSRCRGLRLGFDNFERVAARGGALVRLRDGGAAS